MILQEEEEEVRRDGKGWEGGLTEALGGLGRLTGEAAARVPGPSPRPLRSLC